MDSLARGPRPHQKGQQMGWVGIFSVMLKQEWDTGTLSIQREHSLDHSSFLYILKPQDKLSHFCFHFSFSKMFWFCSRSFLVGVLGSFMHSIISSTNRDIFTSPFPIYITFFFPSFVLLLQLRLQRLYWTVVETVHSSVLFRVLMALLWVFST